MASPVFDVRLTYDRAERLTRVFRGSDNTTLKAFSFGSNDAGNDWRNGKLTQALRFNRLPIGLTVKVFEDYTYAS